VVPCLYPELLMMYECWIWVFLRTLQAQITNVYFVSRMANER